jgi:hypothetical protein
MIRYMINAVNTANRYRNQVQRNTWQISVIFMEVVSKKLEREESPTEYAVRAYKRDPATTKRSSAMRKWTWNPLSWFHHNRINKQSLFSTKAIPP